MTYRDDGVAFRDALSTAIGAFKERERRLRAEHARDHGSALPPSELLERPTRRFLIDEFLKALGWDPGDPAKALEEARSRGLKGDWLFFDYLGVSPRDRAPVALFEAKRYDLDLPREPYKKAPDASAMPELIARSVNALRRGDTSIPVVSEWSEYLTDMLTYLKSFDAFGRSTLKRAMISAGRWIIVFSEPSDTFLGPRPAEAEDIHCFVDFDDMLNRHIQLLSLLARDRLVDTLALVLDVQDAIRFLPPDSIKACFRGYLVQTTSNVGPQRVKFPHRVVCPAVIVRSGGRLFGIVDFKGKRAEPGENDPEENEAKNEIFLADLASAQNALEKRLRDRLGLKLDFSPLTDFEGFPAGVTALDSLRKAAAPVAGSTAERGAVRSEHKVFAVPSDENDASNEFLVVTGTERFAKDHAPRGEPCRFHDYRTAKREGVCGDHAVEDYRVDSFTRDGQARHCANVDLLAMRAMRCRIKVAETHLCCRACIYETDCWSGFADDALRPCPS